jgi:hypothetical protein
MSNKDKIEMILSEIRNMFPGKMILNATQASKVLGVSTRTFARLIENEEWDRLPKFKRQEVKRKDGLARSKYQFSIFDIAEFLSQN